MCVEDNKAIVGRWFTEFWGERFNPDVIDELAGPEINFSYSCTPPAKAVTSFELSPPHSARRFLTSTSGAPQNCSAKATT